MTPLEEGALEVARRLRDASFEAYFAGGCVRDLLRGEPPKDYDLTTNARPEEMAKVFRRTVLVGAAFGVVRVLIGPRGEPPREYEVATYRKDSTYTDGRHPDQIEYSKSKEEDVVRRDFTINALLMDPFTREVIDVVGGRADLAARVIRAVGDPFERIAEDKLRMLRAVRFAARLGYEIEAATRAAITQEAAAISAVSVERIVTELEGIYSSADPARGYDLLIDTGLWPRVLSFAQPSPRLRQNIARLPEAPKAMRPVLGWALVLEDAGDREEKMRLLKLSRAAMRQIDRLIAAKRLLEQPNAHAEHERVRLILDPDRALFLAYARAIDAHLEPWSRTEEELKERPLPPHALITGEDLKQLGIPAGRIYKELLSGIEVEVYERRIKTKDEAIAWIKTFRAQ